ncbi:MAG TPA: hypothetical protein VLB80_04615 [Candidatus Babeliales bacterium]|nr:hypothetical protein [Candidatus Babeliales bacterium]
METKHTNSDYKIIKYNILRPQCFRSDKRFPGNYPVDTESHGQYFVSNSSVTGGTKIIVCFFGYFKEPAHAYDPLLLAQNPLSMLDIETGINTPFKQIPELEERCVEASTVRLNNNSRPLHMLDADTGVIGYNKKIFIVQNSFEFKTLKGNIIEPLAKIVQTLSSKILDDDSIHTVDSSRSHLVVVSLQGHIITWPKNGIIIDESKLKTMQCGEKFFSCVLNHKENLLCLGLENGKLFIVDLADLTRNKIVSLFPDSRIKINLLSSYNDLLLAVAVSYCANKTEYCCKKDTAIISPTCEECKKRNYNDVYGKQQTIDLMHLDQLQEDLEKQLTVLNNKECIHVTSIKKKYD